MTDVLVFPPQLPDGTYLIDIAGGQFYTRLKPEDLQVQLYFQLTYICCDVSWKKGRASIVKRIPLIDTLKMVETREYRTALVPDFAPLIGQSLAEMYSVVCDMETGKEKSQCEKQSSPPAD